MGRNSIVVLGAGLAGLSTGYHLKGNCLVYEKDSSVGGLCKSIHRDGFIFDYTGHLLHTHDEYIDKLINKLLKDNVNTLDRNAWIYSKGVFTRYPFQTNLYGLPLDVVKECLLGLIKAIYERKDDVVSDYESWIYKNMGEGIARHFMIPYNWKLFTVHPREMGYQHIDPFIPSARLEDTIEGALTSSEKRVGYAARFYYPRQGGIEALCKAFAAYLPDIKLSKKAVKVDPAHRIVTFEDGETVEYFNLVSTGPLPELIKMMGNKAPANVRQAATQLSCSSLLVLCLGVNRPNITDKHTIYFPEEDIVFYRVGFPMNLAPSMCPEGKSSIYAAVPYSDTKKLDRSIIVKQIMDDLIKVGILRADDDICLSFTVDMKYAYVIFDHYYQEHVSLIHDYLRKNNIHSIGRYGAWEYSTMEQAILQGKRTATEVERHEKH